MILRVALLLVLAGLVFCDPSPSCGAQEGRGWGSSWTTPHSEQEKIMELLALNGAIIDFDSMNLFLK